MSIYRTSRGMRVGVVVTTMLTLIAYRFMLANHVPRLSYLTRLDWFMLGATVLVLVALLTMAGTSYLVSRDQEATVKKIDRAGRVLYPVAFLVYSLIVWLGRVSRSPTRPPHPRRTAGARPPRWPPRPGA